MRRACARLLAFGTLGVLSVAWMSQNAAAQMPATTAPAASARSNASAASATPSQPVRLAEKLSPHDPPLIEYLNGLGAMPGEHPLMPALRWARAGLRRMEQIRDYSCTLVKRERIDGELGDYQYIFCKVRHKPFSVYMYFLGPPKMRGQECIYVEGANNGKLWGHTTGLKARAIGTVSLNPRGMIAMRGNKYPITEVGFLHLTRELIAIGENDTQYGECEVQVFHGAKINGRSCICLQAKHPVPRRNFRFHLARIYVDDVYNIPIRYEAYDWPREPGGPPLLTEEYTYLNVKLNQGFTDLDFDPKNPAYSFP